MSKKCVTRRDRSVVQGSSAQTASHCPLSALLRRSWPPKKYRKIVRTLTNEASPSALSSAGYFQGGQSRESSRWKRRFSSFIKAAAETDWTVAMAASTTTTTTTTTAKHGGGCRHDAPVSRPPSLLLFSLPLPRGPSRNMEIGLKRQCLEEERPDSSRGDQEYHWR
ncbi:hypothetical protein KM043_012547 [Ampulex compressa]|nr:hypothetical protein KM043_012547 [Ampulex compressa]